MRVVIADRAVEFAQNLNIAKLLLRSVQTCNDIGQFLAERRRARGLPVRARQHRHVRVLVRHVLQLAAQVTHLREQDVAARTSQHQRIGQVVDVF